MAVGTATAADVFTICGRYAKLGCKGPNQAKAFGRCGMGPCQGRYCGLTVTELLAAANAEITEELLAALREAGIKKFEVLYVNDLDRGPFISNTLNIDPSTTRLEALVEIYRMMRPGEPPTKEAAENLFNNQFFSDQRYDMSAISRINFNRNTSSK